MNLKTIPPLSLLKKKMKRIMKKIQNPMKTTINGGMSL